MSESIISTCLGIIFHSFSGKTTLIDNDKETAYRFTYYATMLTMNTWLTSKQSGDAKPLPVVMVVMVINITGYDIIKVL